MNEDPVDWRARFEELGGLEPVRGASILPVTGPELADVERALGVEVPEPYRTFLGTLGGSAPRKTLAFSAAESRASHPTEDLAGYLAFFYGSNVDRTYGLAQQLKVYRDRMPEGCLPIAGDGFGNQICLVASGDRRGEIFYWDHDDEWDEEDYTERGEPVPADLKWQNMTLIAKSFEDFVDRLSIDPSAEEPLTPG